VTDAADAAATPVVEAEPTVKPRRLGRTRSVLSVIVGVIAVIGLLATVIGVWVRAVLTDSDRIGTAVEDALRQPEVNEALAAYVNNQIFTVVDVSEVIGNALPAVLRPVAVGVEAGLQNRALGVLEDLFATDEVIDFVGTLVRKAYGEFVDLLRGDGLIDGVTVENGQVTLNLLPLLGRGFSLVQERLGLLSNLQLPELTRDGDPAAQIASLEQATGRDLPDDFGQLAVYDSAKLAKAGDTLANAQRAVVVARRALVLIAIVTVIAFAGAILLARRKIRAAVALLLSSAAVLVVARLLVRMVTKKLPDLVDKEGARVALTTVVDHLTTSFYRLTAAIVIVALVTAVLVFLSGPSTTAQSFRNRAGKSNGTLYDVVAAHRSATAIALGALFVVNFLVLEVNIVSILIGLALLILIAGALWAPLGTGDVEPESPQVTDPTT